MNTLDIVTSVEAMTDKTKAYVLNGTIWKYEARYDVLVPTNEIPKSINSDGTPYNGGQGWKTGYRLNDGSGAETKLSNYEVSGFIPITYDDVFKLKNFTKEDNSYNNICFYNANFEFVKVFTGSSSYNPLSQFIQDDGTMEGSLSALTKTNATTAQLQSVAYMRFSLLKIDDNTTCFVNVFEEETVLRQSSWYDTKIPYYGGMLQKILRYTGIHNG